MAKENIRRVAYHNLIADVREEDFKEALEHLQSSSQYERKNMMASVNTALEEACLLLERNKSLSPVQSQNAANDIGIWLANEHLAGRAANHLITIQ